ncbi:MAG TPA: hypothetical protein PKH59_02075 [Candidatus Woesebacteria bacterium]|nr:hypothetical protein [Candidatus Woesebacteria bacterium]
MTIKNIYTLFLGLMVVVFVGVGIDVFYPKNLKMPQYPDSGFYMKSETYRPTDEEIAKQEEESKKYQAEFDKYRQEEKKYSSDVSIISTVAAVVLLVLSLTVLKNLMVLSDGLLLGGLLTQAYGVIRGFESENNKIRFLVVTVGLIISAVVGYIKFIKKK